MPIKLQVKDHDIIQLMIKIKEFGKGLRMQNSHAKENRRNDGGLKKSKAKKRSILFVDAPNLLYGHLRYNLEELFNSLFLQWDEILVFIRIPRERENNETNGKDHWGLIRKLAHLGLTPIISTYDPDPLIAEKINRTIERKDIKTIGLLSSDSGFFETLRTAKRRGYKIKVIVRDDTMVNSLKMVADDVILLSDYADIISKIEKIEVKK